MRKADRATVLCVSALLFMTLLLLLHTGYSFCFSDEPFYTALLHRLYLGEALIADEWNPVQFYAPLLYPFYLLYKAFMPSGEGVIRFFRILYIPFAFLVSFACFLRLKRSYSPLVSLALSLLILLYSRANIAGCSYYNLFFLFSLAFGLLAEQAISGSTLPAAAIAGFFLALTILCNPYFLPLTIIGWLVAFFVYRARAVKKTLIWILTSCAATGIVYLLFLLSRASIHEILENLPFVIQNPGHQSTILSKLHQIWGNAYLLVHPSLYLLWIVMVAAVIIERYNNIYIYISKTVPYCLTAYLLCMVLFLTKSVIRSTEGISDGITYPCTVVFSPLFLRTVLSGKRGLPVYLYILGLAGALAFFLGSNTGLDAMTVGFTICTIAGFLMLEEQFKEKKTNGTKEPTAQKALLFTLMITVVVVFGCHRFIGIYRDAPIEQLTVRLAKGPAAGLKTTPEHAAEYQTIYDTIQEARLSYPEAAVMFARTVPWAYLCANWEYGSPSAWANVINQDRLRDYYQLHPRKIPRLVFLFEPEVGSYGTVLFNSHKEQHDYNENPKEGWFWETYLGNADIIMKNRYLTVYELKRTIGASS